jgi:hypothetical protein
MQSDDCIVKTAIYGLYHPFHFHSFCNTNVPFVPTACAACTKVVYPFMSACVCLRCQSTCHRGCVDLCTTRCQRFTFKGIDSHVNVKSSSAAAAAAPSSVESIIQLELDGIVERVRIIPTILGYIPEPGTEFCIWKSVLRSMIGRKYRFVLLDFLFAARSSIYTPSCVFRALHSWISLLLSTLRSVTPPSCPFIVFFDPRS